MTKYLATKCLATVLMLTALPALASDNILGLYYDTEATVNEVSVAPMTTHSLYLVLLNPVNEDFAGGGIRDVAYVLGFECAVELPPGDMMLGVSFPAPALNVGTAGNIVAAYGLPIPVTGQRAAHLATLNVLAGGNNSLGYHLAPAVPASHANTMAYLDRDDPDDNIVDMVPVSGSFAQPVFVFGSRPADENLDWGAVKSLFR